jgi:hypothetical protein
MFDWACIIPGETLRGADSMHHRAPDVPAQGHRHRRFPGQDDAEPNSPGKTAPACQSDLAYAARSATTASSTGKPPALTRMRPRGVYSTMPSAMSEATRRVEAAPGHRLKRRRVDSERLALGKLVDIGQWQGTADDLFGTAIRVAIERLKERRDVYPASEETASETAPVPGTKSAMREEPKYAMKGPATRKSPVR